MERLQSVYIVSQQGPCISTMQQSLQRRLVIVPVLTNEDLPGVPGRHGYSRSAREPQPVGDRCGRTRRNVDIVESHRNGPQLSTRHDDDDDNDDDADDDDDDDDDGWAMTLKKYFRL